MEDAEYEFESYTRFYVWTKLHPEVNLAKKMRITVAGVVHESPLDAIRYYCLQEVAK